MKVQLTTDKGEQVIFSNDTLDTLEYVTLQAKEDGTVVEVDVSIDELISAIKAFEVYRRQRREREKYLS